MAFQLIAAGEAEKLMHQVQYIVIDLRDYSQYCLGHIEGAINLPYDYLDGYMMKLPKNKKYILYCNHGAASMIAGRKMDAVGLDVLSISGGILSYRGRLFV